MARSESQRKPDKRRAEDALVAGLLRTLPAETSPLIDGTHTQDFSQNLVPTLTITQVEDLTPQLAAGGGSELSVNKNSKARAHAAYSSATFALNAFGAWLGREPSLRIGGLGGWPDLLRVEAKLKISHEGGTANLDVLLAGPGEVVGVESKLTEHLGVHKRTPWQAPYLRSEMSELLDGHWRTLLASSIADDGWHPRRLDLEQLIKHALALRSKHPESSRTLVYVFWEPTNIDEISACSEHRAEVEKLTTLLGTSSDPAFLAVSYAELFSEWEHLGDPDITRHVAALRARYDVAI